MKISLGRAAFAAVACLSLAIAFPVFSQDLDDVTISGRITDPNGQSIVGATVTATQVETGLVRSVTTNDDGRYRIIELPPGTYKVKAEATGFGAKERIDLVTVSGQNVQLNLDLAVGGVSAEVVTVGEDDAPVVDTTRIVVGGTITALEIEELPNANRNPLDLVLTLGGTAEESLSTSGLAEDLLQSPSTTPLEQGNFSLSGGTAYSNNITIDGLDNNDDRSSRDRFQPSVESIVEVQVITNQFSAEYGRASGGRINLRTRAGTNRYRGRAFFFFRDAHLNANSWYNNSRNIERPPFTDWTPGFTFSGPVKFPDYNGRNKTFFSVAYEYDYFDDTTLIDSYVPFEGNPRFTLPDSTGGQPTCDSTDPTSPIAPCFDDPPTAGFVVPYTKLYPTPNKSHSLTARADHNLFRNNDLTVGWQFGRRENLRTNGSATARIDEAFQAKNINTDAINFTDNHVFGPNLVNQFRGQWSRYTPSYQTAGPDEPVVLVSYRDPVSMTDRTLIAGNSTTSSSAGFSDNRNETRWQFLDAITFITGSHTIKAGFDYQHVNSKTKGLEDASGTFNFNSVLNYTNNNVTRYRQNFGTREDVVNTYWGIFANDKFNPFSHMTISYGLRYERETAVSDSNNFGPRLGIAWDPLKDGKGVIRFGAGIFYNRVLLRTVANSIQNTGPGLVQFDTSTIGTNANDPRRLKILEAISNGFPGAYSNIDDLHALVSTACAAVTDTPAPCTSNTGFTSNVSSDGNPLRSVEPNLKIPESYQFNVGFEREIAKGFVFEANFTWNKTVHLWRDYNPNAPRLPAGYDDWTDYLDENSYSITNTNGTIRTYDFVLGSTTDVSGVSGTTGTNMNVCSFSLTNVCTVNLNSTNSGSTTPMAAFAGQNNNATGNPIGIALAAIAQFRPDSSVEETSRIGSHGKAFYQGLILQLRRRYRQLGHGFGMSIRGAYTLSSTRDDGLNNTSNAEINGDFNREWARNLQDRRHRIAVSGVIETPNWFGKLRLSPVFRYGSAGRFNLGIGGSDRNLDDLGTDRLNFSGDLNDIVWREPGMPFQASLASQFSLQPIGAKSGNLPRNAGRSPSFYTFDLGVTREIRFRERMKLRPFVEFGNILNAAVFNYGAGFIDYSNLYAADNVSDPTQAQINTQTLARERFLVPTRTYRQRQIRLGVRFDF